MGYTTVRKTLAAFFDPGSSSQMLTKVYNDWPWFLSGENWPVFQNELWGAIGAVHIDSSDESRITLPQYTGSKFVAYRVSLLIWYQYLIPSDLPLGTDESDWVVGLDLILDWVKGKIRSDANAGDPTVIFQMGDGAGNNIGQPDLAVESDLPVIDEDGGAIYSLSRVTFSVYEIITA